MVDGDQPSGPFVSRRYDTKPTRPWRSLVERESVGVVLVARATAVRGGSQARVVLGVGAARAAPRRSCLDAHENSFMVRSSNVCDPYTCSDRGRPPWGRLATNRLVRLVSHPGVDTDCNEPVPLRGVVSVCSSTIE